MNFTDYSGVVFDAFVFSNRKDDLVTRKREIIDSVLSHYNTNPASILFVGFNPAVTSYPSKSITVTHVNDECLAYLRESNPDIKYADWHQLVASGDKFDLVVAVDEFLTFAATADEQKRLLENICAMANRLVITTLRDYKNQGFKDREFSIPAVIRSDEANKKYLEYHDYNNEADRNAWVRSVYEIQGNDMRSFTGFECQQMFFKQCAKFSFDAGATDFLVHRNLMYKSLIKKNYEHVISIKFGQNGHIRTSR